MKCPSCAKDNVDLAKICSRCGSDLQYILIEKGVYYVPGFTKKVKHDDEEIEFVYAEFWHRALALAFDLAILAILLVGGHRFFGDFFDVAEKGPLAGLLGAEGRSNVSIGVEIAILVGWALMLPLAESSKWKGSPGKWLTGLEVTDLEGERISFARAFFRLLCRPLSVLTAFIGYLMADFTPSKQTLHDLVSKCIVIKKVGP